MSASGTYKQVRCKVLLPYVYPDYRSHNGKACMDIQTGASEIVIQLPKKWRKEMTADGTYSLVLSNRVGLATVAINLDVSSNTAPVAVDDAATATVNITIQP